MDNVKYLYRYEMEHWEGVPKIYLRKLLIIGRTPKGTYVKISGTRKRWFGDDTRNRYAHKTEEQTLKGYIRRKIYRNHCIELEKDRNDATIEEAKRLLKNDKERKK